VLRLASWLMQIWLLQFWPVCFWPVCFWLRFLLVFWQALL
jgi:hypothetical protein